MEQGQVSRLTSVMVLIWESSSDGGNGGGDWGCK